MNIRVLNMQDGQFMQNVKLKNSKSLTQMTLLH